MVEHTPFFLTFLGTLILWFAFKIASCFIAGKTRSLSYSTVTRFYNESQSLGFWTRCCAAIMQTLCFYTMNSDFQRTFVLFHWIGSCCMTCWELLLFFLGKSKCLLMWHAIEQSTLLTSKTIFNRAHKDCSGKENNTVVVNQPVLALTLSQRDGNIL